MTFVGEYLAVAAGGAIGAMLRYGATAAVTHWLPRGFPWATLGVNVIGSLLMGVAFVLLVERGTVPAAWRLFLTVGLLGAFTTFSTFSLDALALYESGAGIRATLYIAVSVVTCLLATLAGIIITRSF